MGKAVNQVFLIGRLTNDVELRSTPQGKQVASFTLAVDKQTGEGADFFDVTAWEKLAELLGQYTHKGSKVHVQGSMQQQTWEQDGKKRSKIVVIARDVTFLDSRTDSQAQPARSNDVVPTDVDDKPIDLSEIPF
jgi:single-strand DNA-binding protein